ncbi:ABC transporter permease [Amycolatopsis rubida]|uniref:ABC transporter permease n=1 Tax=Amycolatopsis rubida TaxID=112413 RepID=A0A1I5N1V0_9PSEU|nr:MULTISPECIES: ABC transporter permease [Amycolatopsis]MYW92774.1 ABC transporter permease [Amycolatopsis rubida]NEC57760.1 ABC transporter permease [Amycolatopsis rubida]OAP24918.1 D-allose transport system permease protein AlsC [Amycolatopsis sp. M39]SFP15602.1 ribose transport system permease protein [Amycolatopsis rubida]
MSAPTKDIQTTVDGEFVKPPLGKRLVGANTFWIALVLIALIAVFTAIAPAEFATVFTFQTLLIETSVLLVLSVGMTFVIITSGIDLSVGSVLIFAGMVAGKTMEALSGGDASNAGWGVILAGLVAAVLAGAVWGLINGFLIAVAGIPPLIVTLGTMGAALGVSLLLNNGSDVRTVPAQLTKTLGYGTLFGGIPNLVLVAVVITLIGAWLLHTTRFGRYTYAVGSNAEAARRSGIGVTAHLLKVYLLTGFLAGIAGFMSLAYYASTTVSAHATDNLNSISATVMGGTSLFGGIGSMLGTVIGVFIPAVLRKGFNITHVQDYWQQIAVGAVLIAAVWFDQRHRRKRNSR